MTINIIKPDFPVASTEEVAEATITWTETGSNYICNPPVTDTDVDYAVRTRDLTAYGSLLERDGWSVTYDDPTYTISINGELPIITSRKGVYNLIIFDTLSGYSAFSEATRVAKSLNLTNKEDRVMLFQAVCGGRGIPTEEDFL